MNTWDWFSIIFVAVGRQEKSIGAFGANMQSNRRRQSQFKAAVAAPGQEPQEVTRLD